MQAIKFAQSVRQATRASALSLTRASRFVPIAAVACTRVRTRFLSSEPHLHSDGKPSGLVLTVANPAVILNNIAQRYESISRILMEYIDNAIDDREADFRQNGNEYDKPVDIRITLDSKRRTIKITDNSSGMPQQQLTEAILTAGESKKKGVPWLNGQFGFGIHAFRAAAKTIKLESKTHDGPLLSVTLDRDRHTDIEPPHIIVHPETPIYTSGTNVYISGVDPEWLRGVDINVIAEEIQYHFERLLCRPDLSITVEEIVGKVMKRRKCIPFDYEKIEGVEFRDDFTVHGHSVTVNLKVTTHEYTGCRPRFFSLGRRINEVDKMQSFAKHSQYKSTLWSHPNIIGYIDVTDAVQTVITRDEFQTGAERRALYDRLTALEPKIKAALDMETAQHTVKEMTKYGVDLSEAFFDMMTDQEKVKRRIARAMEKKRRSLPGMTVEELEVIKPKPQPKPQPKAEPVTQSQPTKVQKPEPIDGEKLRQQRETQENTLEAKPLTQSQPTEVQKPEPIDEDKLGQQREAREKALETERLKKKHDTMIQMQFIEMPAAEDQPLHRSVMVGNQIHINTLHPDFISRLGAAKGGHMVKVTDRTAQYLSHLIAYHYNDRQYSEKDMHPDRTTLMNDIMDTATLFEDHMRTHFQVKTPNLIKGQTKKPNKALGDAIEVIES
ncbi:hypothetical protein SARC_01698 [Sphaeroforma arctica JP610]|uniref:Histidine kinase/HSP90-like ATPase domain-containing protein n=1 Tax=Sphaeroforma arctica JP610 TaxID=667725 RepID=A0A0L0GB57_9EUKA|nr:hypothetical protein SARC_01698 [Sphaeroforma arctica JP610]KNC86129.1 hypothetical protein SARC_01698 [Sphaeroforma arctica JP610]|eukprot:XP_014160031.1 hypothetical protein SARC_01698 [Sphaeroforma arctica JP610]